MTLTRKIWFWKDSSTFLFLLMLVKPAMMMMMMWCRLKIIKLLLVLVAVAVLMLLEEADAAATTTTATTALQKRWTSPKSQSTTESKTKSKRIEDANFVTINPFDRSEDVKSIGEIIPPLIGNSLIVTYGITLILNSYECTNQLRCMTMFRATGQERLEKGIKAVRRNIRDAAFTFVRRSPSFYFARRSIKRLDNRVFDAYKLIQDTKQARSDGIITPQEARKLKRARQKEIKNIKRDMRRIVKAGSQFKHVIKSLDFNEIGDIARGFAFQILAVLSTGDSNSRLGVLISNFCLFQNLASLTLDVNMKLQCPISTLIVSLLKSSKSPPVVQKSLALVDKENLENVIKLIAYGYSAYLVIVQNSIACTINNSLLSASIVLRGLKGLIQTLIDRDEDDDDGLLNPINRFLNGKTGGTLMVILAAAALSININDSKMKMMRKAANPTSPKATLDASLDALAARFEKPRVPDWIQSLHIAMENSIDRMAQFLDDTF